ncbi:MAG: hypothetical protein PHV30_00910 [Candidatus Margulisbacteria bacterium]|nr:hypothetical protein [Candidatus Margulisiibacteriota bacterium]
MKILIRFIFVSLCLGFTIFADEIIDENTLFGSTANTMVESKNIQDSSLNEFYNKESVNFSGSFSSKGSYYLNRKWLENGGGSFADNRMVNYFDTNLLLDVRLKKNFKTFLNLQVSNIAQQNTSLIATSNLAYSIKELFMDMNINRAVYIRSGKQVLQWGRTYFWNPTDVLNIQKKNFLNLAQYREGTYGIKIHVPNGAGQNTYMFLDFNNANNIDDVGLAAKYEFLLNNTEYAFSAWKKKGFIPLFGFDFSSRLEGIDVLGEMTMSYGDDQTKVRNVNGTAQLYKIGNAWVPKISLGLSKSFSWIYADQITLISEFFYNDSGYTENVFKDSVAFTSLIANNLYVPNYHSKYYMAVFGTIAKYPFSDSSVNCNYISNLCDSSSILSTGISYSPVNNFTLQVNVNSFIGPELAEYTFSGYRLSFDVFATMLF